MTPLPRAVGQRLIFGILALVCAAGAVVLLHRWMTEQRQAFAQERTRLLAEAHQKTAAAVVASKDLSEGTMLEASHLRTIEVPESSLQPYAAHASADVLGLITIAPLAEGEQVLLNKLRRPDVAPADATLSALMPKGKRGVTIAVDTITGVGGFVRPGDAVDILWTVKLPAPGQSDGQVVTLTLFQNAQVMAVGPEMAGRKTRHRSDARVGEGAESQYIVTLALTPQETSFLLFAREQGRVQLALRSRAETESQVAVTPATVGTLNAFMEAQMGGKPEAPANKPPRVVEVYKGLQRNIVSVGEGAPPASPAE